MASGPASYKRKEERLAEEGALIEREEEEEEPQVEIIPGWVVEPTAKETYIRLQGEDPICRAWSQKEQGETNPQIVDNLFKDRSPVFFQGSRVYPRPKS